MAHPIRLEPERHIEGVLRHILEIVRAVLAGRAIQVRRPDALHRLEKSALIAGAFEVLTAREHQMLEQVGKTGLAWSLVFRADVIPDVDGYNGRFMVLV